MSSEMKTLKSVSSPQKTGAGSRGYRKQEGPTVTASGQVMWSIRDLLFPAGHPIRSASKKA